MPMINDKANANATTLMHFNARFTDNFTDKERNLLICPVSSWVAAALNLSMKYNSVQFLGTL